jgi:uncharacterized GH25 family protein
MKFRLFTLSTALIAAPVLAHDFWIQPVRFQTEVGRPFPLTFQVGHAAARQRWGASDRIVLVQDLVGRTRRDLRSSLRAAGPADLVANFAVPGLHVIAMQSNYALSDLPAIRFNDYAKVEGLAAVLAHRRATGATNANGRERYSRRAKALVQVGPQAGVDQSLATRPIGLKLEIVPERNPYVLGPTRMLPIRVVYNGRPLARATVKLTNLDFDARPLETAVTDRAGRASFRVPGNGQWLLNVLWSEPVKGDPNADYDTTFSSLTFGYDARARAL